MKAFLVSGLQGISTSLCMAQSAAPPRLSTAQANVQVLADALPMPGLDRSRTLRL